METYREPRYVLVELHSGMVYWDELFRSHLEAAEHLAQRLRGNAERNEKVKAQVSFLICSIYALGLVDAKFPLANPIYIKRRRCPDDGENGKYTAHVPD